MIAPDLSIASIPDRYIVIFREAAFRNGVNTAGETPRQVAERLINQHDATKYFIYTDSLKGFAASLSPEALQQLQTDPAVAYIEPDQQTPTVPAPPALEVSALESAWGLDRINQLDLPLDDNYSSTVTGMGVHAYIVDTGIRPRTRRLVIESVPDTISSTMIPTPTTVTVMEHTCPAQLAEPFTGWPAK